MNAPTANDDSVELKMDLVSKILVYSWNEAKLNVDNANRDKQALDNLQATS